MFSVLMSLYIKENPNYLKCCLDSLVIQSLKPSEVVIVYDGDVGEKLSLVVDSFQDKLPLKIIKLEDNVGLGIALKIGLSHCSYNIVARMDTDDICKPERFEKQLGIMNKEPSLVMLGSGIIEFDEQNNQREKVLPCEKNKILEFSKLKNPFNHMTVVFRKNEILAVGGYQDHLFMEDYNLWLRLLAAGYELRNIKDILVDARVGTDMVKKRKGLRYIKSEYKLMKIKNELNITGFFEGVGIFIFRSLTRLLPTSLLEKLYNKDRTSINGIYK
ncbi:TPA: glycosyltransferase [Raoultella planticola]|uniref:glycosyltransferase n=1 Tax=Raoultella planticola TaxID=575 RepID=UPI000BFCCFCE|nr:glycosyltransferase [Raoultella planticola]ATM04621.1 amylovoran biosynthesis protein AmsE [Raoultella planticola]ATM18172.1 amylovoran biosynthesis protein AmsE [Raoultella planticola]ELT9604834.1 glycosyltransferase [Raoultella planticola]ELU0689313.1 glycosyltransferase [Raoultella planticola]PHH26834.1 amylovoran biosynthesis protein AmsE [Raoultella planticola]